MAIVLTIAELEAASATLDKLQEIAGDETAQAILMQAQLLLLALGIRLVCAVEADAEEAAQDDDGNERSEDLPVKPRMN